MAKIIGGVTATTIPIPSKAEGYHQIGVEEYTHTHGVVTTNDLPEKSGIRIENGFIQVEPATEGMILAQTGDMSFDHGLNAPIVPKTVNYAVKMGLTQNHLTLNEYEKKRAREFIGVDDSAPVPSFKPYNDTDELKADATLIRDGTLYVLWVGQNNLMWSYAINGVGSSISLTFNNGSVYKLSVTNTLITDCTEMYRVSSADEVGDIAAALDSILAMQEALIGGGV